MRPYEDKLPGEATKNWRRSKTQQTVDSPLNELDSRGRLAHGFCAKIKLKSEIPARRSKMKRSEFLKRLGIGSVTLASLPGLFGYLAKPAWADDEDKHDGTGFDFVANSDAATIGGVGHRMFMNGSGRIHRSRVTGGGSYIHFDTASPVPRTILGSGTWRAERFISFDLVGTYGAVAAGILEMEVTLLEVIPSRARIPANMEVACNLGFAGLQTGEEEGFILSIPDAPFGPFRPLVPAAGVTVFTVNLGED